ncbi:MAG: aminoacyl-tRNA hydrolase [Candidatus Kerfeldbacteria bacterium]|nr:aminoacyl-tRNA hydrolase [Candidatus Kerfeldbacteria bacterium]
MNFAVIIGLGNPGPPYDRSRHNIGWRVLDQLVTADQNKWSSWKLEKDAIVTHRTYMNTKIFALKPQTFMNDSGAAVSRFVIFYKVRLDRLWVVHDDVDLPFGELRSAFDRGSAGHRGVESITEHLGSQAFNRLRIGVGSNRAIGMASEDYVLQPFTDEEEQQLVGKDGVIAKAVDLLSRQLVSLTHEHKKEDGA